MKHIDCTTLFIPYIAEKLKLVPSIIAQCIVCLEDNRPIAGVVYEGYHTISITAHIWIEKGKIPSKEWYAAIFDYPFNQLGIKKIMGQVNSTNLEAQKIDEHLGFHLEAVIKDYSPDGDLFIYTMTKDQCRILNNPKWNNVVQLLKRVS